MEKQNVVILFTDDQRFDTINALGNSQIHTPNIDRLVKEGTSFTNAHIPGGTCKAVCMPSRAMLHTGRTLFHLQDEGQEIPENHTLLGEVLQKNGYKCFGTGKWHNGASSYARSFTDGGEIFFGGMWDHWNVPSHSFDKTGKYESAIPYVSDAFHSNEITMVQSNHIQPGKHSTDLFSETVTHWIEGYKEKEPFFLNVAFMAPHDPRTMPEQYMKLYNPDDIELPENYQPEHLFDYGIRDVRDEILEAYPREPEKIKRHIAEYYAMISHLDDAIGKILKSLEDSGKLENTIIVFAGDNGLALGQHGLMGKQSAYEHSVRVPLIFNGPGIPAGQILSDQCYLLDIFPTLMDYLGFTIPDTVEGNSLMGSILKNDRTGHREALYFAYEDRLRAVKMDQYKLIEYANEVCRRTQLFNLEDDPRELTDLSEKQPEKVEELRKVLLEFRDSWNDTSHPTGREFWKYYELN